MGTNSVESLVKIGDFQNYHHGIGGEVFMKDEKTLVIKGFTYDGSGPDAFFWTGTEGKASSKGTILPYPFTGKFYHYEDQSAPILGERYDGTKEITLTLPKDTNASDLKWLSVWCRAYSVNFGDTALTFPEPALGENDKEGEEDKDEEEAVPEAYPEDTPEDIPPPLVEPAIPEVPNTIAHDPNRHDDESWEDPDVALNYQPEPENSAPTFRLAMST